MLPKHISNANYLAKPQLSFRDPVNNSNDQPAWTPTLPTKHHSMVPLEWKPSADDMPHYAADMEPTPEKRERDLRARDHPYFYETKHLPYPTSLFSSAPAIAPKPFEDTPFVFVETPEQLEELTATLKKAKEIAVDLEANSTRSYYGLTCLMQISTRDGDWVVDTLALRAELRDNKLGGVLADPSIVKVFHGADSDIVWLQRDFDLYVVNLFDTYHACKVLGE
jgi:exosome complex exonuclease RRP6